MPARQAAPKPAYRIRNWKQYNDALVRRGSLTLWVDQQTLQAWRYQGPTQRGAQFEYSALAIECTAGGAFDVRSHSLSDRVAISRTASAELSPPVCV